MEPIQPLLASAVAALVRRSPMSTEKVLFAWRAAVGAAVARATTVRLDSDRVLAVEVQDDGWADEIERSKAVVLVRLQEMLGAESIERVHVLRRQPRSFGRGRRAAMLAGARKNQGDAT